MDTSIQQILAMLHGEQNPMKALQAVNRLLKRQAKNPDYLTLKGDCCFHLNDMAGAEAAYAQALKNDANHPQALAGIGLCHLEKEEPKKALSYFDRGLLASSDSKTAAPMHYHRAVALTDLERFEEAIEPFTQAFEVMRSPHILLMRSNAWHGLRNLTRAIEDCSTAIGMNPTPSVLGSAYHNRAGFRVEVVIQRGQEEGKLTPAEEIEGIIKDFQAALNLFEHMEAAFPNSFASKMEDCERGIELAQSVLETTEMAPFLREAIMSDPDEIMRLPYITELNVDPSLETGIQATLTNLQAAAALLSTVKEFALKAQEEAVEAIQGFGKDSDGLCDGLFGAEKLESLLGLLDVADTLESNLNDAIGMLAVDSSELIEGYQVPFGELSRTYPGIESVVRSYFSEEFEDGEDEEEDGEDEEEEEEQAEVLDLSSPDLTISQVSRLLDSADLEDTEASSDVEQYYIEGMLRFDQGLFLEALVLCEKAIKLEPTFEEGVLYVFLARIQLCLNAYELAEAAATEAIQMNSLNPRGYFFRGLARQGLWESSKERPASDLVNNMSDIRRAIDLFENGEHPELKMADFARDWYRRAFPNES